MITNSLRGLFQGLSMVSVRRSALYPFILLCLFITIPCIFSLPITPEKLQYYVLGLAIVPVILFSIASMSLLIFDRDRLHTEEYLERRHAMEIVEDKSDGLVTNAADLIDILNPETSHKALPNDYERGK